MTGLTAPPSPRSRVCRLRMPARRRRRARGSTRSTRTRLAVDLRERAAVAGGRANGSATREPAARSRRPAASGRSTRTRARRRRGSSPRSRPADRRSRRARRARARRAAVSPTAAASFGVSSSHECSSPSGMRDLAEDVPRVELGVHVVEREADLALAVADRPRDRARAAVAREQRRMPVDDAVPRELRARPAGSSTGTRCRGPGPDRSAAAAARSGRATRA